MIKEHPGEVGSPEYQRSVKLKHRYGITMTQYDELLAKQGGTCACCSMPPMKRRLDVDHDHDTGAIRGLLCTDCNTAIGLISDSAAIARRIARYLDTYTA